MTSTAPRFFLCCATVWLTIASSVFAADFRNAQANRPDVRQDNRICAADLETALDQIAARPALQRARIGVSVQPLNSSKPLYAREAQRFFLPASTTKVLTTAAALTALGPDYQIKTPVQSVGKPPTLDALKIVGQGDPSFSDQTLQKIAKTLHSQGVRRIKTLIGDDTVFKGPAVVPSWEWEDLQAGWGSPVNSLMVNENAYEVRLYPQVLGEPLRLEWQLHEPTVPWRLINRSRTVSASEPEYTEIVRRFNEGVLEIEVLGQLRAGGDSDRSWIAVVDPGPYFLRRLRAQLEGQGIKVNKTQLIADPDVEQPDTSDEQTLTEIQSPPLSELIYTINQDSNNLYAEAVLKTLGVQKPSNSDTLTQGLQTLKQTLTKLSIDSTTYDIADGSGLSRHNLVSPEALVQTLKAMDRSPHAEVFKKSLRSRALAGLSPETVLVKTGSMTGVSNLSGYVRSDTFAPLAFTIFFNQYNQSRRQLTPILDEMLMLLARLEPCS
ncbi:D-alanyl-D-alanine carboxypeptidase [Acaryochloris thomasi RCC1774]|uniref:D-alanyl-D-alanine carboxypeptidase n=1 Tax=Acaryochloris thomasi RCC1774 TaxID=1764569 RepID=A0A2W1JIZ2_9CYAN|nr:D-alanyl-D-alanine carboxypeptidase/D-alanyl-D-alanine-endopeptidase [Acaryochloris thomasi]PZD73440.1 D-alanyl-D-alanine carboxypeptidase [Acaryochloris thomasi RCC1774]